ncbi:MAG: serine/threonine protein kinase [Gemmatimonadetes bacterium]|nr:serine/threonine protein kinase [Gemmatimonadota bacterium]
MAAKKKYSGPLEKGREICCYRIEEPLGSGGMGEVWVARHRMLDRPAAVKMIRPEALGPDRTSRQRAVRRFVREARATSALRSHHTIDLYDFGVTEEGAFYYIMELLDGLSLGELVRRFGPLPAGRVIYLLRQVCHALGEAHDAGMVHRDIKPGNIFACHHGPDFDFVKVLDFGLVKTRDEVSAGEAELTAENIVAGTPAFMAPEIATGGSVDGRADTYALGCVAYWLLTGQPVFDEQTPLAVVLHHVQTEPAPPSTRTETEVPAAVERVILSCLGKDPDARPQSAGELDSMLAACPSSATWDRQRARDWWSLHISG